MVQQGQWTQHAVKGLVEHWWEHPTLYHVSHLLYYKSGKRKCPQPLLQPHTRDCCKLFLVHVYK